MLCLCFLVLSQGWESKNHNKHQKNTQHFWEAFHLAKTADLRRQKWVLGEHDFFSWFHGCLALSKKLRFKTYWNSWRSEILHTFCWGQSFRYSHTSSIYIYTAIHQAICEHMIIFLHTSGIPEASKLWSFWGVFGFPYVTIQSNIHFLLLIIIHLMHLSLIK